MHYCCMLGYRVTYYMPPAGQKIKALLHSAAVQNLTVVPRFLETVEWLGEHGSVAG